MAVIHESTFDTRYFQVKINKEDTVNLFIHNSDDVPKNKVVYDFFASGALYINLPNNYTLLSANDSMQTIYRNYILPDNSSAFIKNPNDGVVTPPWTERYKQGSLDGWIFDISILFNIEMNNSFIPICKHYTGFLPGGKKVVSPNYHFANESSLNSICSNDKVYANKFTPHGCMYSQGTSNSNFSLCPFYEYQYEVIESFVVDSNTPKEKTFELRYIKSSNQAIYQVFDVSLNQINYSSLSEDTPESLESIKLVFKEIVSSYNSFELNQNKDEVVSNPDKKSYILSLV